MAFRLDRIATLYLAKPLRKDTCDAVPILMYHSISEDAEQGKHPYYRTATSPKTFAEHMQYLRKNNFHSVTPGQACIELREASSVKAERSKAKRSKAEKSQAGKPVVITFDDGFLDFYTEAFPVLRKYGLTATMYLPTAFIADSRDRSQESGFKGKPCMSWTEIRELAGHGISFGSHTVNHPKLYGLDRQVIQQELSDSKAAIEDKLGTAANSFAYPYSFPEADRRFKEDFRKTLTEAGYTDGVCTTVGLARTNSDPFFLPRLPINSCDDEPLFIAKLAGAYDWIARPQYFFKAAKQRLHRNSSAN
jgi:peptidoglycan/xylan/chitin deacetylase (PgdA/CDA1 family)